MKKVFFSVLVVAVTMGLAFGADVTPKDVACEAGCKKTLDDCKGKAGGNRMKDAGCKAAHDKCLKNCKAEKKEEKAEKKDANKGKKVEKKDDKKRKK